MMRASSSSAVAALASAVEAAASTHLLALAADTTRGQPIEEAAAAMEAAADARTGKRNARSGRLIGTWSLVYTNSRAVVGNTGLTGAGRMMLGARLNALRVCYDLGGAAWAEEQLSSLALLRVRNRLTGTWAVGPAKDGNTVEQTYAELETHPGGMKLRSDSKAVVDVTYLDDEWRIARAPQSRDLFVFRREEGGAGPEGGAQQTTSEDETAAGKARANRQSRRMGKK